MNIGRFLGLLVIFLVGGVVGGIIVTIAKESLLELENDNEEDFEFWDEEISADFDQRYDDDLK